jgi:hypothetical protein
MSTAPDLLLHADPDDPLSLPGRLYRDAGFFESQYRAWCLSLSLRPAVSRAGCAAKTIRTVADQTRSLHMARYFLHLYNQIGPVPDDEGAEAADLHGARMLAILAVRDIIAEEARKGRIDLTARIEIADETSAIVAVVPFSEAVELRTA